jgi:DNA-binding CsgD family transcriptional regulator
MEIADPPHHPEDDPQVVSSPASEWHDALTHDHLRQIFTVLEAAHDARPGTVYRETLVESLARVYGVRGSTFFFGSRFEEMFLDPAPTLEGIGEPLMRNYREHWYAKDVFALPTAQTALLDHGFVALAEIPKVPDAQREYVSGQLVPHGLGSAAALHLRFADGDAILGLFDRERRWTPPDILAMRTLARHLQALARGRVIQEDTVTVDLDRDLSPRLREVAVLVGQGLTNAEIAASLTVTEMTVKKYISRIFEATGLTNRAMLAVAVRSRY